MIGIITFAYGAPVSLDDLDAYYTHINNGKELSPEKIEGMKDQFRHIGVGDTLGSITKRQIEAVATTLELHFNEPVKGYAAYKHTKPFVEDVVKQMVADGVTKIITFPIKALHSKSGFIYYQILVRNALKRQGIDIPILNIEHWHDHPLLIQVLSNRVRTAWDFLPEEVKTDALVVFTSHSLPGRPETHQAFEKQYIELAQSIAKQANISQWRIAYRSAGAHSDVWLGPDVKEVIANEAERGCKGVIVCELLSLTSNVEAAYDIGYDMQDICKMKGMEFFQTAMVDDAFDFIMALTNIIQEKVSEANFIVR